MLIDPLTDADCTYLRTLAITVHKPYCTAHTDHLTKVVQTLYSYINPPNEMGSPQTAHLCILPKDLSLGRLSSSSHLPTWTLSPSPTLSSSTLRSSPLSLSLSPTSPISSAAPFNLRSIRSERHPRPCLHLWSRCCHCLAPLLVLR